MIMLEESIKLATKAYVFDPNVSTTWVTISSMITNFLTGIWKQGGLRRVNGVIVAGGVESRIVIENESADDAGHDFHSPDVNCSTNDAVKPNATLVSCRTSR